MKTISSTKRKSTLVAVALVASLLVLTTASTRHDALAGPAAPSASVQASVSNQGQPLTPVSSAFTYQGELKSGGVPANGQFDFQFSLYDAASGGNQVESTITVLNQTVTDGLFTVQLNFIATSFQGQGRWLQIAVRQTGGGSYTTLSPRQPLSAAPYAMSLMPGAVITGTTNSVISAIGSGSMGVYGESTAAGGRGVVGHSNNGTGVRGTSTSVYGVEGATGGGTTVAGVYGSSTGVHGVGVRGAANNGTSALGVAGNSSAGRGVYGSTSTGTGVWGESTSGFGVYGTSSTNWAIKGFGASGVWGDSVAGYGVSGSTAGGPSVYGVYGTSTGVNGIGVAGHAMNGTGARGVWGNVTTGDGVHGSATNGSGVYGSTTNGFGVQGVSSGSDGGHFIHAGTTNVGYGVYGRSELGNGVHGVSNNGDGGVFVGSDRGVAAGGNTWAGYFLGNVGVSDDVTIGGNLSKASGSFKIDHPLDPENKYLYHSFVESPDMMNVYNGNVTLDSKGEAIVTLPEWFEALNKEFRYQLTTIGGFAPVYVAEKVQGNRFKIAGGKAGLEVSWQVTGIRKDPYAEANRIRVEVEKPSDERGKYLHPIEHGQPESKWVHYEEKQRMMQDVSTPKTPKP